MFAKLKSEIAGKVHFVGIGGIGMSALALLLNKIGIKVQGSDLKENGVTQTLHEKNISYFIGQEEKNIDDEISLIVKTSIIKDDNPEIIAAKKKKIKIIARAELLAKVMLEKESITVAGTHGKTSTVTIISEILEAAKTDPIVINGGIINQYSSNFKLGGGDFLIAESDESDGSFVNLPTKIGVVTNIEPEHLDFYGGDYEKVKLAYKKYIEQIPEDGMCALCIDDEEVAKIYEELKEKKQNLISYSIKKEADIFAQNISFSSSGAKFDAVFKNGKKIENIDFSAYGSHNVSNALSAIAIANFLDIDGEIIKKALKNYQGVKRRFTKVGEVDGVTIIDDYAHHPTEIIATLNSARQFSCGGKVILVLQPHKHSRVQDLFEEFCSSVQKADIVILADIYKVGSAIEGVSQDSLILRMRELGHKNIIKLEKEGDLPDLIAKNSKPKDIVICAGAGTITNIASNLPKELEALKRK